MTNEEMIAELGNFDTPSITNVVATYPNNPLCLGLYNPWRENWLRRLYFQRPVARYRRDPPDGISVSH